MISPQVSIKKAVVKRSLLATLTITLLLLFAGCASSTNQPSVTAQASDQARIEAFALKTVPAITPTAAPNRAGSAQARLFIQHIDPLSLPADNISIAGSSTVFPITKKIADDFNGDGFVGLFDFSQSSTVLGISQFCAGEPIDVVNASRQISEAEIEACAKNGREVVSFNIGYDPIVFIVHPDNFWLTSIDPAQLDTLLSATNWSQLDPTFPDRPVIHYVPDQRSEDMNTLSEFLFERLEGEAQQLYDPANARTYSFPADMLREVASDPNSIGFVNFANAQPLGEVDVKIVPVGRFNPLTAGFSYPIHRRLHLITDKETLVAKPEVATFIAYYLNEVDQEILTLGFGPLAAASGRVERINFVTAIERLNPEDEILRTITLKNEDE